MRLSYQKLIVAFVLFSVVLLNSTLLTQPKSFLSIDRTILVNETQHNVKKNPSYGIAFVTYGSDFEQAKKYAILAQSSALLYRQYSLDLPIALLTSHPSVLHNNTFPFTDIISIPSWMLYNGRQWLTRTQAIRSLLPYSLTFVVDSDTIACGDLTIPLQNILASDQSKFAIATGSHEEKDYLPDNGIMLFNKDAPGFQEVMDVWFNNHIKRGITSDDQRSLHDSTWYFQNRNDVFMGVLHPTISCRWHPGKNQTWTKTHRNYDQTLTLNGFVYILHMYGGPSPINNLLCSVVNKEPEKTRVMVWKDHNKYPYPRSKQDLYKTNVMAYSPKECQELLDGFCYDKLLWENIKTKNFVSSIKGV